MEIRKISYKNVYGMLSDSLSFKQGENILVGINGSGKTTVLNMIRWLLGPSLPDLCTLQHEYIELEIKHENHLYSIESRITDGMHELSINTKNRIHNFKPIRTPLTINPKLLKRASIWDDVISSYRHMTPEPDEVPAYSFLLKELPSPIFVGLERSVDNSFSGASIELHRKQAEVVSAQKMATNLMRDAFNTGKHRIVEIGEDLNKRVIELSFSGVVTGNFKADSIDTNQSLKKIKQLKSRFEKSSKEGAYSKALSAKEVRIAVVNYLEELEGLVNSAETDDIWVMLNQHNFERTSKMFDLFEEYEKEAGKAQKETNVFKETVNSFLCDSGKSICFNESTGSPYFIMESSEEILALPDLSSGETQIVVLLSYFAFLAKSGIPIIIDEPELSLHVEWQKHLVNSVKKVMPIQCQTIMATHSPEICGASDVNIQSISLRREK
jgi:predicted ATP-binding protein involved in virulence